VDVSRRESRTEQQEVLDGASMTDADCEQLLAKAAESCERRDFGRKWAAASWLCVLAAWVLFLGGFAASFKDMFGGPPPWYAKYGVGVSICCGLLAMLLGTIAMVQMIREDHSVFRAAILSGMLAAMPFLALIVHLFLK
jgi:hypothetical protein